MLTGTETALKKQLTELETIKANAEKEIKIVRSARSKLGVKSPNLAGRRLRTRMSAAERKSVSKRMKMYWAKRRAEKRAAKAS